MKSTKMGGKTFPPQINAATAKVFELGGCTLFVRVSLMIGQLQARSRGTNLCFGEVDGDMVFVILPESIISICARSRLVH